MTATSQANDRSSRDATRAVIAGFLGWTLDAFDFFLVVMTVSAIAKDLHVEIKQISLSLAVTLAFRPVGAFIFGLLADRYGRRIPMMIDLVFYSAIEVATGFAKDFHTFIILRALFGIGMGGEWGVGASLVMEKVSPKWRGVLSGLLQEGYAAGYLLAAVAYYFVFPRWGWRPLFFIGGLPALLALFIRVGVKESEVWQQTRHENWSDLFAGIASHWKTFLYLVLLMTFMNLSSHGTQDMYPTFLERDWHFSPQRRAAFTAAAMAGAIAGGVLFGLLSDRIGRRRSMLLAFAFALIAIPLWAFSPTLVFLLFGGMLMQFMVQGAWGVIPAHITELSDDSVRGFLPGFAYQCGVLIAGSIGYVQTRVAEHMTFARAMAGSQALVFIGAIVVIALGRERHKRRFGR